MKNLEIKNSSYRHLIYGFREWLDILGFCSQTVYNMPHQVQEFLHFLENKGINHITQISPKDYKDYYDYLNTRPNQRRSGGLTNMYINHQIKALSKFYEFLIHKGANGICPVILKQIKLEKGNITVLIQQEIRELYEATKKESRYKYQEALNGRDRAMLSVFYGCGLRRIEGSSLDIDDINFDRRTLHVRRGKNYKERLIPFSKSSSKYLKDWIYDYRLRFVKDKKESTLFISRTGKPMTSGALYRRLKLLVNSLDDTQIHSRDIGLHTLRHSIATHLLENGMELSKIQRFLGHSSLESTQIYTHLIHKNEAEEYRSFTPKL